LKLWQTEQRGDVIDIVNLIRSGLVRNLGNITAPRLYNRAYAGTKNLIEDYVTGVTRCVKYITEYPTTGNNDSMFTSQTKLDVLHDTRLAFGRTVLVLQGGAMFGLCHLGVIKALHLRGLLPRIISGTATGALIAALVCVHSESELLGVLSGSGINVKAFASQENGNGLRQSPWYETLRRRFNRWSKTGHFLDVRVLEELLKSNIGDITFEEAYKKTKRVLNITVTTSGGSGVPNLLNYITAPNVVRTSFTTTCVSTLIL
jgi:TAG lipase/lysophosphatidylethanolamine acyltransferase